MPSQALFFPFLDIFLIEIFEQISPFYPPTIEIEQCYNLQFYEDVLFTWQKKTLHLNMTRTFQAELLAFLKNGR